MKKIVVIGEVLVEIMADSLGEGFLNPLTLTGPFPSGAPAIFIDQVARLGQPCGIISTVGDDDFGRINISRLQKDGVDISGISIDKDRPTGSAFVRYRPDGTRDFIFNIRHSACGTIHSTESSECVLSTADHFHIMGSSFSSPEFVAFNLRAAHMVKERGGTISFDPNLRKELLSFSYIRNAMDDILKLTDLFLPSGEELFALTSSTEPERAVQELFGHNIKAIVHKQGAHGVCYYDPARSRFMPAFSVTEVDPTGAGDCFGAAFTVFWLRGESLETALTLACAAGALAVTQRGPMEGVSDLKTLLHFSEQRNRTSL